MCVLAKLVAHGLALGRERRNAYDPRYMRIIYLCAADRGLKVYYLLRIRILGLMKQTYNELIDSCENLDDEC